MAKIALITDTHWGIRQDSQTFLDYAKRFYDNVFFPKLEELGIKTIIHLGDLVDRRKYINYNTASRLYSDFMERALKYDFHMIIGNHDTTYKNTNQLNAVFELYRHVPDFKVYIDPTEVMLYGKRILFLPWICPENREQSYDLVNNTKASVVMGHLELRGFEMYKGILSSHGDDSSLFSRFNLVASGHYHRRSYRDNIVYLGAPYEFTWSDYEDTKGFHIYDTDTDELTFIQNPYIMFHKIFYDDSNKRLKEILDVDFDQYKNGIVKVVIQNKTNPYWFDKFLTELEKQDLANLQIVEDHGNLDSEIDDEIISEAESTLDIFKKYIAQTTNESINKDSLEKCMINLYNEAVTLE
jgi:predicted phosphodiesterase